MPNDIRNFFNLRKKRPNGADAKKSAKKVKPSKEESLVNTEKVNKAENGSEQKVKSKELVAIQSEERKDVSAAEFFGAEKKIMNRKDKVVDSCSGCDEKVMKRSPIVEKMSKTNDKIENGMSGNLSEKDTFAAKAKIHDKKEMEESNIQTMQDEVKTMTPSDKMTDTLNTVIPEMEEDINLYKPSKPLTLSKLKFVLSGVHDEIDRESLKDYILTHGGSVRSAVSGVTDYLVIGKILEDGRDVVEGKKYKEALGRNVTIIRGVSELNALVKKCDHKMVDDDPEKGKTKKKHQHANSVKNRYDGNVTNNPYSRGVNNPYATTVPPKALNPYAKNNPNPYSTNPYASSNLSKQRSDTIHNENVSKPIETSNMLWADMHAPTSSREILGNGEAVSKLARWLNSWEQNHLSGKKSNTPKAALLSGPPGIGKTTTATIVSKQAGREILELNASDTRSKKSLQQTLGDVTGSHVLSFASKDNQAKTSSVTKRCIIMDEVDGMGAGDRSGISELIQIIKKSKVPIICICNDRQAQKLKSLIPYCLDLKYRRPSKSVIARRAIQIARDHSLEIEQNAAEALAESCGNDIRQVLNALQMWASSKKSTMTYAEFNENKKSINKDESLRISLFDAARMIVEGARPDSHFYKRYDAFFVDYSFIGLLIHQNYIKVITPQFLRAKSQSNRYDAEKNVLNRLSSATGCMSDFDLVEGSLRVEQNWSMLSMCASLCVQAGSFVAGDGGAHLPGFPEFTRFLGHNSSRGKKQRILAELKHHLNFKISSSRQDLRMMYLPALHSKFYDLIKSNCSGAAIDEMDVYGLDRDDLFENFDQFFMKTSGLAHNKFGDIDSKMKAAFTREYNKATHKHQALVSEQGMTKKRGARTSIDGENNEHIDDESDEEEDEKKIQAMFKKRGGKKKASKSKVNGGKKKKKKT